MSEKTEKKQEQNLRIHLSRNKYIIANGLCYWIVAEHKRKDKEGNPTIVQERLSGYHTDIVSLIHSYFDKRIRSAECDGELEDLADLVRKTRKEIDGWGKKLCKEIDK